MIANIEQKPVDFSLFPRQASDYRVGKELVKKSSPPKKLLTDKVYDTNDIRKTLDSLKVEVWIPAKYNRKTKVAHDESLYKKRSGREIMFGRLKEWREIAIRYCRCAQFFGSFVCVDLIMLFFCVRGA